MAAFGASSALDWEYELNGRWVSFDTAATAELRAAVQRSGMAASTTITAPNGSRYNIDLSTMTQTNVRTGYIRQIRARGGAAHGGGGTPSLSWEWEGRERLAHG